MTEKICPQCGKPAYDVMLVSRPGWKELDPISYWYMRYRHYAGSRRSITLTQLKKAFDKAKMDVKTDATYASFDGIQKRVMENAQRLASSKTIDHYVSIGATPKGEKPKAASPHPP